MHRKLLSSLFLLACLFFVVSVASAQSNPCSGLSLGQEASLNGFIPFPSSSLWNTNIANAPVDPNSAAIISFIGTSKPLHPDFGSGLYNGQSIGIPYIVVPGTQGLASINFTAYGDESDPGPMPVPGNAPIEGYPNPDDGDRHVLVIDQGNCWLYELYHAYAQGPGLWTADSSAVWDLEANEMRPYTWTSADAAGLPISPAWSATTRSLLERLNTHCGSPCSTASRRSRLQLRIGRLTPTTRWLRLWVCVCV